MMGTLLGALLKEPSGGSAPYRLFAREGFRQLSGLAARHGVGSLSGEQEMHAAYHQVLEQVGGGKSGRITWLRASLT